MKKGLRSVFRIKMIVLAMGSPIFMASEAIAVCSLNGTTWTCDAAGDQTQTVGVGQSDNGITVNVNSGATINVGDTNAISLGNGATIINNGTVSNAAVHGGGNYGTGANTIEVKNNAIITNNGTITQTGSENNAEAINVHGFGNVITNNGTIQTNNAASIWFQDWSSEIGNGGANQVINNGVIRRVGGGNVIGTSAANATAPGIEFTNNGLVDGSLFFAGGNDKLTFLPGSNVTGNINGGGGENSLFLEGGNTAVGGTLVGAITNFSTLTKSGTGIWTVSGPLQGFRQVTVQQGVLALTGNNDGFLGTLTVLTGASLEARAQSLPTNNPVTGNTSNVQLQSGANLVFVQNDDGTYIGQIVGDGYVDKFGSGVVTLAPQSGANLYTGPTSINDGGLAINSPSAIGSGVLSINNGSLITTSSFTMNKDIYIAGAGQNATAIIDTQGNTLTLNNSLMGVNASGTFVKAGSGLLILNGENRYLGATQVAAGTMRVNNNGANNLPGDITVLQNARLEGSGSVSSANSNVINAGTIAPGGPTDQFGSLTIRGNYVGQLGGLLDINTILGNDSSPTSKLVIEGDTSFTPTNIRVINHNGLGALTIRGIPIIEVHGNSDPGAFRLEYDYIRPDGIAAVIGGSYVYHLYHIPGANGHEWVLNNLRYPVDPNSTDQPIYPGYPINPGDPNYPSYPGDPNYPGGPNYNHPYYNYGDPVLHPAVPVYEAYSQVLSSFNRMPTLQQRVGNRSWESLSPQVNAYNRDPEADGRVVDESGVWGRVEGNWGKFKTQASTSSARYDLDFWRMQLGVDVPLNTTEDGSTLIAGINGHYGRAIGDIKSYHGDGKILSNGYGFGTTLTWYEQNGFYIDAQFQATWLDSDIKSYALPKEVMDDGNKGFAYAVSLETGRSFDLNSAWSLTPQAQIVYSQVDFDNFRDPYGTQVSAKSNDSLLGRAGLAINHEKTTVAQNGDVRRLKVYGITDVYYEFLGESKVSVGGVDYKYRDDRTWVGPAVGGSYNWGNDDYSVYSEVGARTSVSNFGDSYVVSGELGVRIKF